MACRIPLERPAVLHHQASIGIHPRGMDDVVHFERGVIDRYPRVLGRDGAKRDVPHLGRGTVFDRKVSRLKVHRLGPLNAGRCALEEPRTATNFNFACDGILSREAHGSAATREAQVPRARERVGDRDGAQGDIGRKFNPGVVIHH